MSKPFLSIVTRCCRRPVQLTRCIESVVNQTCHDIEQVFLVDKIGRHRENPILWANKQLERYADRVDGEYVYVLDDDGQLADNNVIYEIRLAVNTYQISAQV